MEILEVSKPSVYASSKRLTPDHVTKQLVQDLSVVLESFKVTGLHIFIDMAKEIIDKLYATAHDNVFRK